VPLVLAFWESLSISSGLFLWADFRIINNNLRPKCSLDAFGVLILKEIKTPESNDYKKRGTPPSFQPMYLNRQISFYVQLPEQENDFIYKTFY